MNSSRLRRLIPVLPVLLLSASGSDLVWPFNNALLFQDWEGEASLSVDPLISGFELPEHRLMD
jgi:hypothetical protein